MNELLDDLMFLEGLCVEATNLLDMLTGEEIYFLTEFIEQHDPFDVDDVNAIITDNMDEIAALFGYESIEAMEHDPDRRPIWWN